MAGTTLKRFAKSSRAGVVAGRISVERSRRLRRALGRRDGPMGATHRGVPLDTSVAYVEGVYADYLRYGGLEEADLEGARVLEIGPGDNFGVALKLLAAGAERVVVTDRFIPFRDPVQERLIYEALIARMPAEQQARVAGFLEPGGFTFEGLGFEALEEVPIEECAERLGGERFPMIVSRAVLEHVYDLEGAFDAMAELIEPGGRMLHKVDLRDHGLFTDGGHNALTFLTVPDLVYRMMGARTAGIPNRRLRGFYEQALRERGFDCEWLVTHAAGVEPEILPHVPLGEWVPGPVELETVRRIRPKLPPSIRSLPEQELAIAGFFVVATAAP